MKNSKIASNESNTITATVNNKPSILEQINELLDSPIILTGYDEFILGYDPIDNGVIYDALGIINKITDERMEEDEKDGQLEGEWEDYYDNAQEWVLNGLLQSCNAYQCINGVMTEITEQRPKPKLLMHFID